MIFTELDPDLRRARRTLRVLAVAAAGAAIGAVFLASSSPVFAAEKDSAEQCRELFQASSYDKAAPRCAAAAQDRDSGSQAALGWMYLHGRGLPKDEQRAAHWMKESADQGNMAATAVLGGMYLDGVGVAMDRDHARKLIAKAAENGHSGAQAALGSLYIGDGARLTPAKATPAQDLGASGQPQPEPVLAEPREQSREASQPDPKAAVKWYRKAARNGSAAGQAALGEAYRLGVGVEQDPVTAYMWYSLAADQGSRAAADARELVAAEMKPKQIAKAAEKAREWKDSHTGRAAKTSPR